MPSLVLIGPQRRNRGGGGGGQKIAQPEYDFYFTKSTLRNSLYKKTHGNTKQSTFPCSSCRVVSQVPPTILKLRMTHCF